MDLAFGRAWNSNEQFWLKDNLADEDFMIHVVNNLPNYDVILDRLENHLTSYGDDAFTIEDIREKLNHRNQKIKNKNEEKREEEKALGAYNKWFKERHYKCGKYCQSSMTQNVPNIKKNKKDIN